MKKCVCDSCQKCMAACYYPPPPIIGLRIYFEIQLSHDVTAIVFLVLELDGCSVFFLNSIKDPSMMFTKRRKQIFWNPINSITDIFLLVSEMYGCLVLFQKSIGTRAFQDINVTSMLKLKYIWKFNCSM